MILKLGMMIYICLIFLNRIQHNIALMGLPKYRPDGATKISP